MGLPQSQKSKGIKCHTSTIDGFFGTTENFHAAWPHFLSNVSRVCLCSMVWSLVLVSELTFLREVLLSTPIVFSSFIALHFMFKSSTHFVLVCVWRQGLASFFCVVCVSFTGEKVAFPVLFLEPWLKRVHKRTIFHLFSWSVCLSARTTLLLLWRIWRSGSKDAYSFVPFA